MEDISTPSSCSSWGRRRVQDPNQLIESSTKSRQFHQVTALTLFHILVLKGAQIAFLHQLSRLLPLSLPGFIPWNPETTRITTLRIAVLDNYLTFPSPHKLALHPIRRLLVYTPACPAITSLRKLCHCPRACGIEHNLYP